MSNSSGGLNIAIISSPILEGGTATHLKELVPRLRQMGHKVLLVTEMGYGQAVSADLVRVYKSWRFPVAQYGFMPSAIGNILGLVKGCDLIHVHGYTHFLADYLTATRPLHGRPLVFTLHGSLHQFPSLRVRALKALHNLVMLRLAGFIDRFIAVSEAEKAELIRRGLPEGKIEVIYNGVSGCHPNPGSDRRGGSNGKRVLFLGRLTATKNPALLIKAISHARKQYPDIRLVLAGADWGERRNLHALASSLGIDNSVEFVGEVAEEDKAGLFASCDVFVHPSLQDIFSICILEAAIAGLPTVAFNVGGNSEMIEDGKTGILVGRPTPEALSDGILRLLNDSKLAREMGEAACSHIVSKFSWEQAADRLEKVYRQVSRRGRGAG